MSELNKGYMAYGIAQRLQDGSFALLHTDGRLSQSTQTYTLDNANRINMTAWAFPTVYVAVPLPWVGGYLD